ncbi:MAG: radical SAM protein, partial [Candidatus Bipolaricaulota bacterium]
MVFGPVPSRRLGRSLGINNVPPKACTYSCVYCQLGRTMHMETERRSFYKPEEISKAAQAKVQQLQGGGEAVDYLTFVPDGEPTLDLGMGQVIDALKGLGLPIAVISNASLIFREGVREALAEAAWVSLKVDAVTESIWHRVNRPHKSLSMAAIQAGLMEFSRTFQGTLATETMLVSGINDRPEELERVAEFLRQLDPQVAYLAVPTRPPAAGWVEPPSEMALGQAHAILSAKLPRVELLIGYEGDAFAASGDAAQDLLSITAVHPMREQAVRELLSRDGAAWKVVENLIQAGELTELE